MIIIVLLSLISFNLFAAELSPLEMARADDRVRQAQNEVIKAEYALVCAQLEKHSEEDIKGHKAKVAGAAQEMLFTLATLKEQEVRVADIDFCLERKPNLNAIDEDDGCTPLMYAAGGNITLVRELIRAGADLNFDTGDDPSTAIMAADSANIENPIKLVLLEAGAAFPCYPSGRNCWWFWDKNIVAHRQKIIGTINEAHITLLKDLYPLVVDYAFGKPPTLDHEDEHPIKESESSDEDSEDDSSDDDQE
jgi:hypothetical protein